MHIGYARVSTQDQNLTAQIAELEAAGCERIFQEKASGKSARRPELERMLEQLRPGDVVTVTKYDRLGRSLRDLLELVDRIKEAGAHFRSLAQQIDTSSPSGTMAFHIFATFAQFERDLIAERTREGLAQARKEGRVGGRRPVLSAAQRAEVIEMHDAGRSVASIAALFKVGRQTVYRTVQAAKREGP